MKNTILEMQSNSDSDNNDVSGLDDSNDKLSDGSDFIDDFDDDDLNNPNDSDKKPIESIHVNKITFCFRFYI
jgi:hypothetical protein